MVWIFLSLGVAQGYSYSTPLGMGERMKDEGGMRGRMKDEG